MLASCKPKQIRSPEADRLSHQMEASVPGLRKPRGAGVTLKMMSGNPFPLPQAAPLEVIEDSEHACFVLSEELKIMRCNSAWDRFARGQGGGWGALASNVISRNLLDFITPDLKSFYGELFARARALGQPVGHDYECSSATVFRLFRMQIYPLERGGGFVVLNSLRIERPHDRAAHEPNDDIYTDSDGIIHMCANCRRTRRVAEPAAWDWVPAYVEPNRKTISHGVCAMCFEFYYRPMLENRAA
jgi:hypothetical protein